MNERIVDTAVASFADYSTEELLELWLDNDRDLYSAEGFEAMRRVLAGRLQSVPQQVDWDEANRLRSIDVSTHFPAPLPPVPRCYSPRTFRGILLQAAAVMCAASGFALLLIYAALWRVPDLLIGWLNVRGYIAAFLLFLLQAVLAVLARNLWERSKELRLPSMDMGSRSSEPPVLYLRPFKVDHSTGTAEPTGHSVFGVGILVQARQPTFEEVMAIVLGDLGPVVAIGQPGERRRPVGAVREYPGSEAWQARVRALIEKARALVLVVGFSPGLMFELKEVCARRGVGGLILVWESESLGTTDEVLKKIWSEFRAALQATANISVPRRIDVARTLLVCFSPSGELRLIVGRNRTTKEWHAAFQVAKDIILGQHDPLASTSVPPENS